MPGADLPPAPLPGPGDFRVHRRLTTRWTDNDVYGHLNNVIYYSLFDTAVTGWLTAASGLDLRAGESIPVLAETSCRFLCALSFPDEVSVGIGLERTGRTSVVYRLALFRAEPEHVDPRVRALGRFVQVYVDSATRRPAPIPGEIYRALAALGPPVSMQAWQVRV